MSVKLRKRKNADGTSTMLLDIYHNGKRTYEFLTAIKLLKVVTPVDRKINKERVRLAQDIRNKRDQEIQGAEYDITPTFKKGIDFIQLFEKYVNDYNKKDKRVIRACLGKFKAFMKEEGIRSLSTKQITESLLIDFKDYLQNTLKGESPSNYFKKLKRLIKHGIRERIFSKDPSAGISVPRNSDITKDVLTSVEIQQLAKTPLMNGDIKMSFLFCCNTGLRFCDVTRLSWKHIKGEHLVITQAKTGNPVTVNLNKNALRILEILEKTQAPEELLFKLPSHTACLKNLKTWCNRAGIKKKITWHCARHSFAVNLILNGADVNTVRSIIGHTSMVYIQRYLRISEVLSQRAVDKLPQFEMSI